MYINRLAQLPQKRHIEGIMRIFVYIDKDYGKTIIIDPMIHKVDNSMETETNWLKSIYGEYNQEENTANTPKPLGKLISVNVFVDTSHAGEKLTYCSHTGVIIYKNNTHIYWFSKRQNTFLNLYNWC